ncbi:MAG: hypothetical protein KFH87_02950 [Bacteroidetes bacterium]|nr:hypothetical protein [Bacteroidota bacterium]
MKLFLRAFELQPGRTLAVLPFYSLVFIVFLLLQGTLSGQNPDRRMRCNISAPDSVFFDKVDYNRYIPGTFTVHLRLRHIGDTPIDSVVAFPRSNQRFTVIPPASKLLSDRMFPGDTIYADFQLQVNPRKESGMDTIVVAISGKDGARTECLWEVWVEKEYRPLNELLCPPEGSITLSFVDSLNAYSPSPMAFPVSVINHGDAPSKETRLFYVATPSVTPSDGQQFVLDLGSIPPGGRVDRVFLLEAVPRSSDTIVFVPFKVQGHGGLGDRIIDTSCNYALEIPPSRDILFELSCESNPDIRYEDGRYIPNPFEWSVIVRNLGDARATNVRAMISLPVSFLLERGDTELSIGDLDPGEERTISWTVRAKPVLEPDSSEICVRVFDEFNRSAECCDSVVLPAIRAPALDATCQIIPDTIRVDSRTGLYQPDEFSVDVTVRNFGNDNADSLYAEIIITNPDIRFIEPTEARVFISERLEPSGSMQIQWRLAPLPVQHARDLTVRIRITGRNHPTIFTTCDVHVEAALLPLLDCVAGTVPDDTLHFNRSTLEHDPLFFTATVTNRGSIAARDIQATILLPPDISLPSEEAAVRYLDRPLEIDSSWTVTWRLSPLKKRDGSLNTIRAEFRTGNINSYCDDWVFIIGIPPVTVFTIPRNIVERYSREFTIPIFIDESENKDIRDIVLFIQYDADKIDFLEWETAETLLADEWDLQTGGGDGRIYFHATHPESHLEGIGELIRMRFLVRFGDGEDILRISSSPLVFDSIASNVNRGSILARYYNGDVIVSGDCLYPLQATMNFVSLRNIPNPFNPATVVQFSLPATAHVSLVVYDTYGREVHRLQDGNLEEGDYSFPFDAVNHLSGSYFALLRIDGTPVALRRMLLLR